MQYEEADQVVSMIEREVIKEDRITSLPEPQESILIRALGTVPYNGNINDPQHAYEYLTMSSLAMRLLDRAEIIL